MSDFKNYYQILQIPKNASSFQIEQAYQKLATYWHPDRHKQNRLHAEKKFHDISEAYQVLSNKDRRSHYDELHQKQYSIDDANKTFQRFFDEHGVQDQKEKHFFQQHYPQKKRNYYDVLEIPRSATSDDIKKAYRRLALKYHPKNNGGSQSAQKKFVEVNEAYNALSTNQKRQNYDNILFGSIVPNRAHDIFQDFMGNRFFDFPTEQQFFKPILKKKWSRNLDRMMEDDESWRSIDTGETVKTSQVFTNHNGVQSKKTVTTKRKVDKGIANTLTTQQYEFPDGTKQVRRIRDDGRGTVQSKVYYLNRGEQLPPLQN